MLAGVEQFGKYFKRKGWVRSEDVVEAEAEVELRKRDRAWNLGEGGARVLVEFATAYTITKALLPIRIMFSVWCTPGFARWAIIPVIRRFKMIFGRRNKPDVKKAAETGAIEGGAVPLKGAEKGMGS